MVETRTPFAVDTRTAIVDLLKDYADSISLTLQVYRARPSSVQLPTAYIERTGETITRPADFYRTRQRLNRTEVVVLWGLFDGGSAVDQRDRFVDGFINWVDDNVSAIDPNTSVGVISIEDDPSFLVDWIKPEAAQRTHYASRITLEGFAGG